jgi:autonomous glycyl radical cofactor GrcA
MVVQVSKQALEDDLYQANTLCDSFKNEAQQLRALLESKDNMIVTLERTVRYVPVSVNFVWVTFSEIFFLVY